jgi:hypothetical protein
MTITSGLVALALIAVVVWWGKVGYGKAAALIFAGVLLAAVLSGPVHTLYNALATTVSSIASGVGG